MNQNQVYFDYLQQRSFLGKIYRNFWLYPILNRFLKGRALDVGCGIGDMLLFRPNTIGVDVNQHNVSFCISRGGDAKFMDHNVLPFDDASFDSVLLDNVLEHIQDPAPMLLEIKRVLRTNGVLLIGVPGQLGYASDIDHKVFYDEIGLISLAKGSGFFINKIAYLPLWKSSFLSKHLSQYCIYSQWSPLI